MHENRFHKRVIFLIAYLLFAILPVYWMVNMSFKTNEEILGLFSLWPRNFTLDNYRVIFTDASWYSGYINSMIYVAINTVVSLLVALPAAYAFSRYSFIGDKHVFFWLLTNRMTPPAVFLLPFFQLDGGHIAYALFGARQRRWAKRLLALFVVMIAFWPGWALWAAILVLVGPEHPPIPGEREPLDRGRLIVGWVAIAIFVLCFTIAPIQLW
jgi:ABC-type glycerol-3-phosphate transport system permease component